MDPGDLRRKAEECRQLAGEADEGTAANLLMLADDYEAEATRLQSDSNPV